VNRKKVVGGRKMVAVALSKEGCRGRCLLQVEEVERWRFLKRELFWVRTISAMVLSRQRVVDGC
jgi:hypothetical protein